MFLPVLTTSMLKRAQVKKKVTIKVHDLRKYTKDKHKKVDDRPFGGGPGMVMMAQPIFDAVRKIKGRRDAKVILLCPTGTPLTQRKARSLAKLKNLILVCGHYEGVDHRVETGVIDESISIGDYVLTGGELPAMVVVDCVTRLIPGVLGDAGSLTEESFEANLLDYPQYTRPANFRGKKVPNVLLSGNHNAIKKWRGEQALIRTGKKRPDLLKS
jgi:tRNA (guanine37-N1)-methyltransferase